MSLYESNALNVTLFHFTATTLCRGQIHLCPQFSAEPLCRKYLKWPKNMIHQSWHNLCSKVSDSFRVNLTPKYWESENTLTLNYHSDCKQDKTIRGSSRSTKFNSTQKPTSVLLHLILNSSTPPTPTPTNSNLSQLPHPHTALLTVTFCFHSLCSHRNHLSPTQCPLFPAGTDGVPSPAVHLAFLRTIYLNIVGFVFVWTCCANTIKYIICCHSSFNSVISHFY